MGIYNMDFNLCASNKHANANSTIDKIIKINIDAVIA